jgi:hypothetical protein
MAQQQEYDEFGNPVGPNPGTSGPGATANNTGVVTPPETRTLTPWDHSTFRDEWLGTGNNVGAQDSILGKYGITLAANGTGTMPDGSIMDLRRGARAGDNTAQWMGLGDKSGMYANPGGGGAPGAPGGPGGSGGPKWDDLYNELMKRGKQSLDVNANDPIIRNQTDAFAASQDRAKRDALNAAAERSSPYGTGGMQGQERMMAEHLGANVGGFQAELMGRELQSKRDEISHALDSASTMLSEQQRVSLQRELGLLDAEIRRQGQADQRDQFGRTYDANQNERNTYWDWTKSGGKV